MRAVLPPPPGDDGPWLADEMLGKLARYLRFLGSDTLYVRGSTDREIAARAALEERTVVTRDGALARSVPGSVLVRAVDVRGQLAEMFGRYPGLAHAPKFDRCAECNAELRPWPGTPRDGSAGGVAAAVARRGSAVVQCPECHRYYWDGSHAERIRRVIRDAAREAWPA